MFGHFNPWRRVIVVVALLSLGLVSPAHAGHLRGTATDRPANGSAAPPHTTRLPLLRKSASGSPTGPACRFPPRFAAHSQGAPLQINTGASFYGFDPSVLFDEESGKFKMWYTIYRQDILGIGYAESSDGLVWDPELPGTLPHVLQPTPGTWDADGVETVSVLKKDGTYWMWYLGYPCDRPAGERGRFKCIGLATSDDGIVWQKHPEPVLKPTEPWEQPYLRTYVENGEEFQAWDGGVQEPSVLWDASAGLFRMWYNGFTLEEVTFVENGQQITRDVRVRQIGYATSPDGIHWTKYPGNPVFRPLRNTTTWEEAFAVDHTNVIPDPVAGYHLFYFSGYGLGHAYSRDGIHWTRNPYNPMVPSQVTDEQFLAFGGPSALLEEDGTFRLYLMRSLPGATKWMQGGMLLGLATTRCGEQPAGILTLPFVGQKRVLIIRVKYPGDEGGIFSDEEVAQRAATLRETYLRNSYGRLTLDIDITPLLTLPRPRSYYESNIPLETLARLRADAVAAARQAGFAADNYDREIIYSENIWNASTGMGTINSRTAFVSDENAYLDAHELGHTLDWLHANFWQVGPGESPISSNGTEIPYGDGFDIMGDQVGPPRSFHHFNPWFKTRAGWIPPENILTLTDSGTYRVTLQPYEQPPDARVPVQTYTALRIRRDPERDYWVFWRSEEPPVEDGVVVTWGYQTNQRGTLLLDMTPGSRSDDWKDAALRVGETFSDPEAGAEIRVVGQTADGMQVEVTLDRPPVGHLPVIDVMQPARGQTVQGEVEYVVTAYDPDVGNANGSGIATVRFELYRVLAGEQKVTLGTAEVTTPPPYRWRFDTRGLPASVYYLGVTATSTSGESNTVWFPHIIDDTGPSEPGGPLCTFPSRFTRYTVGAPLKTTAGEPLAGGDPSVIYDVDGFYKVWYTLWDSETQVLGIAYAESRDGLTWTRVRPNGRPHVLQPTPGTWDEDGVETVSVLKKDGTYWMWYYGYPCDRPAGERGRVRCIGVATSSDGLHWVKHPQPVLKPTEPWEQPYLRTYVENGEEFQAWDGGVEEPSVLWDAAEGLFKMWYAGFTLDEVTFVEHGELVTREARVYQIGYATSPDGIHWTKYAGNPVFRPLLDRNDTGWESSVTVSHSNVMPDPAPRQARDVAGGYHLFYFSGYGLGHAYSRDGVHWTRNPDNPMVPAQVTGGQFLAFGGPSALLVDGTIRLYLMRSVPGATKWMEGGMHLGLATAPCQGSTPTTVTVTVDLARPLPDTPSMVGFLSGQTDDAPPLEVVSALSPRLIRGVPPSWQRAQALGARYHFLLSNVWGYPPREREARGHRSGEAGAQQGACTPSLDNWKNIGPPYEHFDCFREAIRRFITGFRDEQGEDIPVDGTFIFDIWNEPNSRVFWQGAEEQFFETFAVAVETVRSLLPQAWIAGPSWNFYDRGVFQRLLDYAVDNDVRFQVLSWHELLWPPTPNEQGTNISAVQQHLEEARRLFLENPRYAQVGLREIHINEYVGPADRTRPGELVAYLSALELGGADAAAHSCGMELDGENTCFNYSLDGLVEPGTWRPRPKWWTYKVYAEGVPGRVASSSTNPAIVPLVSLSADSNAVTVLLGHTRRVEGSRPAALPVRLELTGLPPAFADGAVVTVRHMPDQGRQVLPEPPTVLTATMTVQDGRGSLFLGSLPLHDAWEVRVEPARSAPLVLENDRLHLEFERQPASNQTPRQGSGQAWGLALRRATVKPSGHSFAFDADDLWAITLRARDGTTTTLTPSTTSYTLSVVTSSTGPTQTLTAVWQVGQGDKEARGQGDNLKHGDTETRRQGEDCFRSLSPPHLVPLSHEVSPSPPHPLSPSPCLKAGGLTVTATVTLGPDDPYALWRIAVDNRDPDQAVYYVDFPRLKVQPVGEPETNRAAVPYRGGRLIEDPVHSVALNTLWKLPPFFPYPHMNAPLQLFTYYDTQEGYALYLAAHDGAGYTKAFDFRADGQRLHFGVRQYPEYNITPGNDYTSPYPVAIGALPGDWYDVAKAYRAWALRQPWAQRGPIVYSDDFSARLKASGVTGTWAPIKDVARPFEATAQDMERWKDFLGIEHIAGLWYLWHGNPFDKGWPEYEPVQPSFPAGMTLTHQLGNYAWPYINPMGWDTATASYTATHAADYAMKDEQGRVQTFTSPITEAVFAIMDPATSFWQTFVRDWVLDLQRDYGVDGIYLDVWSGTGYGFDYDPTHGHPTGGGNYIAQGMRAQGRMIRQAARANDPAFIMMSEHPGELFIDLLEIENLDYLGEPAQPDGTKSPDELLGWWSLPLFNTVYHDYIMMSTFVNTVSGLPDLALNEDALSYMWAVRYAQGNLLAVNSDTAPVLQDPVESTPNYPAYLFLRQLVQSYAYAAPYLRYGERLRDLPVHVRTRPVPGVTLSTPQAAQQFVPVPYGPAQPVVFSSAWRSLTDPSTGSGHRDSVGLVFTNWVTTTETITYTFDPGRYGLPAGHLGLYRLDANGPHLLTHFSGPITRTETLPARSLLVLMVAPCPHPYDLSGDGVVDVADIMTVAANWHAADPDPRVDLNGDGEVDVVDVMRAGAEWGQACPYLDRYLLVGTAGLFDPSQGKTVWGVYYSLSDDLIHWIPRQLVMESPTVWSWQSGDPDPTLQAPQSPPDWPVDHIWMLAYHCGKPATPQSDPIRWARSPDRRPPGVTHHSLYRKLGEINRAILPILDPRQMAYISRRGDQRGSP